MCCCNSSEAKLLSHCVCGTIVSTHTSFYEYRLQGLRQVCKSVGGLGCKCEVREKTLCAIKCTQFFISKNYTTIERIKCIIHMLANKFVSCNNGCIDVSYKITLYSNKCGRRCIYFNSHSFMSPFQREVKERLGGINVI